MRGELCWALAVGLVPAAPLPQHPACPSACPPACPVPCGLRKGWQSSAPVQGMWALGDTTPQLEGCPPWFSAFPEHSPLSVRAGGSSSVGKRCWDITMETARLHRAASVCCPLLSAAAVCQRGSDVAVICFGDKGVLHPPALLSTGPLKHCCRNPEFHLGCGLS